MRLTSDFHFCSCSTMALSPCKSSAPNTSVDVGALHAPVHFMCSTRHFDVTFNFTLFSSRLTMGECAGVGARGATAAQESEREARRRRECRSAGRDGGASVRARGAGASDRVQAPVQVSECKRQNRASDRAWQVRGCRSASARREQAPERVKCEVSECQRQIKASARARGATAARVTERGARRQRK